MMDTKGLFVWTLGSVIRMIKLISTLKKLFVSYLSITCIMTHWIQDNNSILAITRIAWITRFLFISCLDQFCLHFPKSSVNGVARKHKWQKSETYILNRTYKRLVWMAAQISYSMAWSVGSPKFICWCITFSHYLNQRIIDSFFQIAPNKCQAYRMKVLSFTLSFLIVNITLQCPIWSDSHTDSIIIRIIIFEPLQALVISWSYLGSGGLFPEFKNHSGNLANVKKGCPWLEPIFKKLPCRK